jgi:hypothetical protein
MERGRQEWSSVKKKDSKNEKKCGKRGAKMKNADRGR